MAAKAERTRAANAGTWKGVKGPNQKEYRAMPIAGEEIGAAFLLARLGELRCWHAPFWAPTSEFM
eukprot:scaffold91061_cov64-Phaeocystis_antarctica.AAC.2